MRKNVFVGIFSLLLLASACKKEQKSAESECIDQYLAANNFVPYGGGDLGQSFFLFLYELDGKLYFQLGNNYADVISAPEDCDGKPYCEDRSCTGKWGYFNQNAVNKGIIGIEK